LGEDDDFHVFDSLKDLATARAFSLGSQVLIATTQELFYCAGRTTPVIAAHLGWTQENVWLPESARQKMRAKHPEFRDPINAIQVVLSKPASVHNVPGVSDQVQFFAETGLLREAGNLTSRSVPTVDVLIELRPTGVGKLIYLRAFHLSPMRRAKGIQLWL
jgi:hypothetical protein